MFPLDRPENYNEMLNKIGIFTFLLAWGLTWIVARCVPSVANLLSSEHTTVEVLSLHVPILYVVPAVIVAVAARIIRLHDKVSDLFRIRSRFDLYKILIPLSEAVGLHVNKQFEDKLRKNRGTAMEQTFYLYASFEEPKIPKALVLAATELWTWYWILLELLVLILITAILLLFEHVYIACFILLGVLLVGIPLFQTCFPVCGRRAKFQIQAIAANAERVATTKKAFEAQVDWK